MDPSKAGELQRNKQPGGKTYNEIMDRKDKHEAEKNKENDKSEVNKQEEETKEQPKGPKPEDFSNGPIAPKYSLVHSYPLEMGQFINKNVNEVEERRLPRALVLKIELPAVEGMEGLICDAKKDRLTLEYKDKYYLSLEFGYVVDEVNSKAKFISSKKLLKLTFPVVSKKKVGRVVRGATKESGTDEKNNQEKGEEKRKKAEAIVDVAQENGVEGEDAGGEDEDGGDVLEVGREEGVVEESDERPSVGTQNEDGEFVEKEEEAQKAEFLEVPETEADSIKLKKDEKEFIEEKTHQPKIEQIAQNDQKREEKDKIKNEQKTNQERENDLENNQEEPPESLPISYLKPMSESNPTDTLKIIMFHLPKYHKNELYFMCEQNHGLVRYKDDTRNHYFAFETPSEIDLFENCIKIEPKKMVDYFSLNFEFVDKEASERVQASLRHRDELSEEEIISLEVLILSKKELLKEEEEGGSQGKDDPDKVITDLLGKGKEKENQGEEVDAEVPKEAGDGDEDRQKNQVVEKETRLVKDDRDSDEGGDEGPDALEGSQKVLNDQSDKQVDGGTYGVQFIDFKILDYVNELD